ncbi:MAG TPA: isoprenylcysteine carboxylmethyltransferase family protein [Desulfosporosinus sp.]|nr:isoprenylcysteine carboxylmethyltransferase family protein [Desulfosporosinus sp.]
MLDVKNSLSLLLFLIFIISYLGKLIILKKKHKIQANVLTKGKTDLQIRRSEVFVKFTTFIWGVMWFLLSILEPMIAHWFVPIVENAYLSSLGILTMALGLAIFIVAMISMKTSWRVGIDKQTQSSLVTEGIYKFTRNPAFLGFDLMFIGLFVTYPNILTLGIAVLNILAIHYLILQEEEHLKTTFHEDYLKYFGSTRRYFIF